MQLRRVGRSGLQVSALGLGTMTWGHQVDEYEAVEQLKAFHDAGGTFLDTSPLHGRGAAETMLGASLAASAVRDRFVVATRAGVRISGSERVIDVSRRGLLEQLDGSLAALGVDYVDIWVLNAWDPSVPIEETLSALALAVQSGRARYASVGDLAAWQFAVARERFEDFHTGVPLIAVHQEYSLVNRRVEADVVPAARHRGVGVIAGASLGRGILTGKYRQGVPTDSRGADSGWEPYVAGLLNSGSSRIVDAVARAAEGLGVSESHVALAWLWAQPDVASAVVSARTTTQLSESLAAASVQLPGPIVAALDDVSKE